MNDFVIRKKFIFNFLYKIDIFNYPKLRERFEILISLEILTPNFTAPCSPQLFPLFEIY